MPNLHSICKEVKKQLSQDELRNLFNKRLDDDLFAKIGTASMTVQAQRLFQKGQLAPHLAVWKGFEIITDSPYL